MEYNIINQYVNFIKREYNSFFHIMLGNKFQKNYCEDFIARYIDVRYFNETNYPKEKDIINRLNKELLDVFSKLVNDDNEDILKNIVALFGYIVYFDDIGAVNDISKLIDTLIEDEDIKLEYSDSVKGDLRRWYIALKKGKEKFNDTITSNYFEITEKRLYRKLFQLILQHNVKISNLYSEFAISKAYNSGVISEDKLFITYILGSLLVLNSAIILDFSRHYIVDMESSLFGKERKLARLFCVIDNPLAKKMIHIRITYMDYMNNKEKVNKYINDGYSFAVIIDDSFDGNTNELILFPYIFIKEDSEYYDVIMRKKDYIKSKVIKL